LLVLGLAPAAAFRAAEPEGDGSALRSTRDTLAKWVETQQILSKEKKDWQLGKEVLLQRIALLEEEISSLDERGDEARRQIAEADVKRRELTDEKQDLEQAATALEVSIATLESKTHRLLKMLPGPIVDRIEPLAQRVPADPATTELSLSERFQNVIGILNEVNKFNRDVTVTTEVRAVGDGKTAEVQTLYLGLGQAYYVTANGQSAGIGRPSTEGWSWTEADELAPSILQAIAIVKNEQVPAYVPLPVEIR
jgi:chromosome segregation ATPase